MVETICVSSSSWHCSTRYTCFTGPWGTRQEHTHTHTTTSMIRTHKQKKKAIFGCISTSLVNKCILFSVVWPAHIVLVCILYLRCPVLVVPYPFFNQPHQRRDVVELGFLENTWHTDKERIVRLHCLVPKFTDRLGEECNKTFYLPQPDFYPWSAFRAAGNSGWGRSMWGPCRSGRLLSRPGGTQ